MDWNRPDDLAMLGEDAGEVMARCELALMLDDWPSGTVRAEGLRDNRAALLRLTTAGRLQCVAIAPSWHGSQHVPEVQLFAEPFPRDWQTKRRAGVTVPENAPGYECGFAVAYLPDRTVRLCKVAAHDAGEVREVQTMPEGPHVPVAAMDVRRWWPFHRWPAGTAQLFQDGRGHVHNYRLLCIHAANLDKRLGKRSKPAEPA